MKLAVITVSALSILAADATAQRSRGGNRLQVWETLVERYDKDNDGKLTKKEYVRGDDKFTRWDSNGDGVISKADFEGGNRSGGGNRGRGGNRRRGGNRSNPQMMKFVLARFIARPADANSDEKVSAAEWKKFCDKLDCDKNGLVTKDEMPNAANVSDRAFEMVLSAVDADKDGKLQLAEVAATFAKLDTDKSKELSSDEMPSMRRGRGGRGGGRGGRGGGRGTLEAGVPRPGEVAPDFDLPLVDQPKGAQSEVKIKLSSFKGKKPVALIFGSYT